MNQLFDFLRCMALGYQGKKYKGQEKWGEKEEESMGKRGNGKKESGMVDWYSSFKYF